VKKDEPTRDTKTNYPVRSEENQEAVDSFLAEREVKK
jgi:hypothetical protein